MGFILWYEERHVILVASLSLDVASNDENEEKETGWVEWRVEGRQNAEKCSKYCSSNAGQM